jgi:tricorn protease
MTRHSLVLLLALAPAAAAQEPIRMARTPDISPDGKLVAFSYLGDIWVVEALGGTARPVTMHPAHDVNPAFSPDGKTLAFSSNRHGSYDVFTVPVRGGHPTRLTFDSAQDMVAGWTPDGKNILFSSTRGTSYPQTMELYTVPAGGGQARRLPTGEGKEAAFSPDGKVLAYVRGPGQWYRKGYRGSANDDIWLCDADGHNSRQLTTFNGQDASPMWAPDGKTLYYVSEHFGTPANIVAAAVNASDGRPDVGLKPRQITFHKEDGARRARISADGEWIVYEHGADLYLVGTKEGSQPRKLLIEAYADDKVNPEKLETFENKATEFAVAPDEKHVIFGLHGNLFLMPIGGPGGGKPTRLTALPCYDHGAAWSPDGNKVLFLSDRDGQEDVYLLEPNDPEHPKLTEAHTFNVKRLTNSREPEMGLSFSPDGSRVAFIRSGRLRTMKPDGSDPKAVIDQPFVFDYEWSPDGKWFVIARRDASFGSELYLVPSTGPTADSPARNITRYATYNGGVTWSADGRTLAFLSERGLGGTGTHPYVLSLRKPAAPGVDKPAEPGRPPEVVIDWDDLHLRASVVAPVPADEVAISPDGTRIAFRSGGRAGDLWVASVDGKSINRLTTGGQRPNHIAWSKRRLPSGGFTDAIYYLDGNGALRMARPAGGDAAIPFKVKMNINTQDEYTEMFDQGWRFLNQYYYDDKFHGSDWAAMRRKYRELIRHVTHKEDLYALVYLMLGELNSSHLGISGYSTTPEEETADLGLIFDDDYRGPGLKIKEVVRRGPADRRGLDLKAGDLVTAIDNVALNGSIDVSRLLNGKVKESVVLLVQRAPGEKPRRVEVQGASRDEVRELTYQRWVDRNAARVAALSGGKLGYAHIPNMTADGLDKFVRALYSDNYDKEAIVLDLRYNGGGFTHDKVLAYLGSKEHHLFKNREGGVGLVVRSNDRRWNKPLVVLVNNRSFSDAEVFPSAVQALGLGKVVGQPTGGLVIFTGEMTLIDGSKFRVPSTGVFTLRGVNREKEGVVPDVIVEAHPDQLNRGEDPQLDRAVDVLKADVETFKKAAASSAPK